MVVPAGAPSAGNTNGNVVAGQLNYSISASDSLVIGYNGVNGPSNSFNISGSAGFVSSSESHPTSFVYTGGYLVGNNGQPSTSFQNLGVSQVLMTRQFTFILSDVISYLPVSPRFGISGIPGVGDLGTLPISTGGQAGDAVLTNYGQRVTNTASGAVDYRLTGRTSLRGSGSYTNQAFLQGVGINNDQLSAGGELDHRFTAATLIGAGYTFGRSTYPQSGLSFSSQSVVGVFQHVFGPRLTFQGSAGPQWTTGSNSTLIPSRVSFSASLSASYVAGLNNFSLGYNRSTSPGSGVLFGSLSDYLSFAGQRRFSTEWTGGFFGSYGHAQSLANIASLYTTSSSVAAGVQATRRLGDHWSTFGSYAAEYQTVSQLVATNNAFDGTAHVISFGITYSPRPLHIGRR